MNKKISIGAAITFIAIAMAITITLTMFFSQRLFNEKVSDLAERETMYSKLAEVDKYVRANEFDAIDETLLSDQLIRGYVSGLNDDYAEYYSASEYAKEISSLSGNIIGIGVTPRQSDDGYIRVVSVYENSPAQAAGILPEDLIVKVENIDVTQDTYEEAVAAIGNGEIGSNVTLVIRRQNEDLEVICTRREIEEQVVSARIFSNTVGYIRISSFTSSSASQFETALSQVREAGVTSLIIDLRNNLGGSIEAMASIVDTLAPEGEIVKAVYSSGIEKVLHRSTEGEVFLPIVVLQNGFSASASEVMIAALQDYGKIRTIGTTSYGKFVMQEIHQFTDGSAVKLTTAQLYSPNGNSYNGSGITPDYVVSNTNSELFPVSLLDPAHDEQLAKGIEVALDWSKSYSYPVSTGESDSLLIDMEENMESSISDDSTVESESAEDNPDNSETSDAEESNSSEDSNKTEDSNAEDE